VVGRRADGYHLIESAFVLIDWADTLHFELRQDGRLQRHDLGVVLPADDLCLRAARALQQASGCRLGADIHIAKSVPSGAGMGGGSSDAASVLLALNRLWGLHWSRKRLLELALPLGADVPFFVGGQNALVQGIGEQLSPIALPEMRFAVLKPTEGIATSAIFGDPKLQRNTRSHIIGGCLAGSALQDLAQGFGHNDLQPPAFAQCPEAAQAAKVLEDRFGNARMTGSGSAVFARLHGSGTGSIPEATWPVAADALPQAWVGRLCRSLPEHPLRAWAE
jgi:4-diphosphocytidyl-2-C-methyl-D-erythritol kinase